MSSYRSPNIKPAFNENLVDRSSKRQQTIPDEYNQTPDKQKNPYATNPISYTIPDQRCNSEQQQPGIRSSLYYTSFNTSSKGRFNKGIKPQTNQQATEQQQQIQNNENINLQNTSSNVKQQLNFQEKVILNPRMHMEQQPQIQALQESVNVVDFKQLQNKEMTEKQKKSSLTVNDYHYLPQTTENETKKRIQTMLQSGYISTTASNQALLQTKKQDQLQQYQKSQLRPTNCQSTLQKQKQYENSNQVQQVKSASAYKHEFIPPYQNLPLKYQENLEIKKQMDTLPNRPVIQTITSQQQLNQPLQFSKKTEKELNLYEQKQLELKKIYEKQLLEKKLKLNQTSNLTKTQTIQSNISDNNKNKAQYSQRINYQQEQQQEEVAKHKISQKYERNYISPEVQNILGIIKYENSLKKSGIQQYYSVGTKIQQQPITTNVQQNSTQKNLNSLNSLVNKENIYSNIKNQDNDLSKKEKTFYGDTSELSAQKYLQSQEKNKSSEKKLKQQVSIYPISLNNQFDTEANNKTLNTSRNIENNGQRQISDNSPINNAKSNTQRVLDSLQKNQNQQQQFNKNLKQMELLSSDNNSQISNNNNKIYQKNQNLYTDEDTQSTTGSNLNTNQIRKYSSQQLMIPYQKISNAVSPDNRSINSQQNPNFQSFGNAIYVQDDFQQNLQQKNIQQENNRYVPPYRGSYYENNVQLPQKNNYIDNINQNQVQVPPYRQTEIISPSNNYYTCQTQQQQQLGFQRQNSQQQQYFQNSNNNNNNQYTSQKGFASPTIQHQKIVQQNPFSQVGSPAPYNQTQNNLRQSYSQNLQKQQLKSSSYLTQQLESIAKQIENTKESDDLDDEELKTTEKILEITLQKLKEKKNLKMQQFQNQNVQTPQFFQNTMAAINQNNQLQQQQQFRNSPPKNKYLKEQQQLQNQIKQEQQLKELNEIQKRNSVKKNSYLSQKMNSNGNISLVSQQQQQNGSNSNSNKNLGNIKTVNNNNGMLAKLYESAMQKQINKKKQDLKLSNQHLNNNNSDLQSRQNFDRHQKGSITTVNNNQNQLLKQQNLPCYQNQRNFTTVQQN